MMFSVDRLVPLPRPVAEGRLRPALPLFAWLAHGLAPVLGLRQAEGVPSRVEQYPPGLAGLVLGHWSIKP